MSLRARIGALFGSRAAAAPDPAHEASAALDVQYATQVRALQDVRDALAGVIASERRVAYERDRAAGEHNARLTDEVDALKMQRAALENSLADFTARLSEMRAQQTSLRARTASGRAASLASDAHGRVAENHHEVVRAVAAALADPPLAERGIAGERDWLPDPPQAADSGE